MSFLEKIRQSRIRFIMEPVVCETWRSHQLWDLQCRCSRTWCV